MHPPLTPTPWDGKLEAIGRKLFRWFVVPVMCYLLAYWWYQKSSCQDYCVEQGGAFVEMDSGGRFDPIWHCVCNINGEETRTAEW